MHTKRIIPCLDVNNGRVVKGVNFVDLKDAGDPVEIAKAYDKAGAQDHPVSAHNESSHNLSSHQNPCSYEALVLRFLCYRK